MSDADTPRGSGTKLDVSVVIPTYDRPLLLERCLRAAAEQSWPHDRYEIVVVDDGPTARTEKVVRAVADATDVPVRYLATWGRRGPATARNIGWRSAAGRVIAFTDDDTIPDRRWLEAGMAVFSDGVSAASGRIEVPLWAKPTDYERDTAGLARAKFVTANAFYRREALEFVGGFDERFVRAWREDTDLLFSLLEKGRKVAEVPDAIVVHPVREGRWGESIAQQSKVEYNPLLYKKHPRLYREWIGHSPRWYYAASACGIGAIVALLARRRALAGILGGLWLGMTAGFAVKRLAGTSKRPSHIAEMAVTSAVIPPVSVYYRLKGSVRFKTLFW